jgi:hypothetical protein
MTDLVDEAVVDWLLEGDPAIRWQVMRDLLDVPSGDWEAERARTVETGWVAEMLARQETDGEWPSGRWTASTWTLLLLVACGIREDHPAARMPIERLLGRYLPKAEETDPAYLIGRVDLCHLGFWLGLTAYFLPGDARLRPLSQAVLAAQYDDGGWNCQMRNYPDRKHSSFNTTLTCSRTCASPALEESFRRRSFGRPRIAPSSSCSLIACTGPTRRER